ncbi:unnamed protein product, partial [Allacma fusca]
MRTFFADSKDKLVRRWFERREVIIVEEMEKAEEEEDYKRIWKAFKTSFIAQYDPVVSAEKAEDNYERFKLTEELNAEEFVAGLQDILSEMDPNMPPKQMVKKMHR